MEWWLLMARSGRTFCSSMTRTLLLTLAATALPASASAYSLADADTAAHAYWGPAPCGEVHYVVTDDPIYGGESAAWGNPDTCTVTLRRAVLDYEAPSLCRLMTHEYGHVIGLGHAAGIMDPVEYYRAAQPYCWPLLPEATPWTYTPPKRRKGKAHERLHRIVKPARRHRHG